MSKRRTVGALGAALVAALAVAGAAAPAGAAVGDEFNPFDAGGGYSIYAREDAILGNAETEGAIAVGGTMRVRADGGAYAVLHVSAGTGDYPLPVVDGEPTRLLIGGFATADNGRVEVTGAGSTEAGAVKITPQAEDSPFGFYERGGWIRYRLTDAADADQPPLIDAQGQAWPGDAAAAAATLTAEQPRVADYVESAMTWTYDEAAQCLAAVTDPATGLANHVGVAENAGDRVVLTELAADRPNVVDYTAIAGAGLIQFSGTVTPGAENPLIIRVAPGTALVSAPRTDSSAYAPYLMWDLSAVSGAVEVRAANSRIDGSVYAPDVELTVHAQPIDGQIIARNLHLRDSSGEAHAYFFRGTIPCGQQPQQTGAFVVTKQVTGSGAALVPADTEFTLEYRLDGAAPVALTLTAGETSAAIDGLPIGTEVSVREVVPVATETVTWGAPGWSIGGTPTVPDAQGWVTFTVDGSTAVAITVTNAAAPVPVDPIDPVEPTDPTDPVDPEPDTEVPTVPGTDEPGTPAPDADGSATGSMPATGADLAAPIVLAAALAAAGLGLRRMVRARRS